MDTFSLILIAVIVVAVVLLIQRFMNRNNYSQQGSNRPQYDDPNVSSHGGFGGNNQQQGTNHRQYDDPNVESHGGFGPSGGSSGVRQPSQSRTNEPVVTRQQTVERAPENTRRNDDPDVNSHGGFGGQK